MEHFSHLKVFNDHKYNSLKKTIIEVPRIGDVMLTEEEESILRRNPKFSIMPTLLEDSMREDMEKALSSQPMSLPPDMASDLIRQLVYRGRSFMHSGRIS